MKTLKIILVIIAALVVNSCEEDFNPFGDYQEKYVFNCVLRGDTTLQVAAVAHTYNPGYDAMSNTDDPFLSGADVRIWYGDSVYLFKDTTIERTDDSRYGSQMNVYKCEKFSVDYNKTIEAEIMLPNGRRLKSSITTPSRTFFASTSSTTVPTGSNKTFRIEWTNDTDGIYYLPDFSVIYYKKENGQQVKYTKKIPASYKDGEAVYFTPVRQKFVTITVETLTKALNEIAGDDDKSNYTIKLTPVFKVAAYNETLSRYYSISSQTFDHLTVRVDENDYSNVDGGYGLFGAFTSTQYTSIKLYSSFITSMGYKVTD